MRVTQLPSALMPVSAAKPAISKFGQQGADKEDLVVALVAAYNSGGDISIDQLKAIFTEPDGFKWAKGETDGTPRVWLWPEENRSHWVSLAVDTKGNVAPGSRSAIPDLFAKFPQEGIRPSFRSPYSAI